MSEQVEPTRDEQILKAKELYSQGSRNYLVKCYNEAADELSQVCALYEEIYGELSDELGMPYLLYAKSLIALAFDENKVIDVPDEEEDDEDDEDDEDINGENAELQTNEEEKSLANKLESIKEERHSENNEAKEKKTESEVTKEADSTDDTKSVVEDKKTKIEKETKVDSTVEPIQDNTESNSVVGEEAVVTSTEELDKNDNSSNGDANKVKIADDEKPSTSNGIAEMEDEEENEAASSLQLAWEILELAAKIFTRQGMGGLPNLAEVQTELANIEFENNILDSAREDYEKALKIYKELPDKYRRAMAEIHYKVGLTYLMQQMNQEGAESLKEACALIEDEINDMNSKENLTDKDTENIKDMEETKQEIWAKIAEIEETRQQHIAEVRAALDNFIGPAKDKSTDEAGPSSSAACSSAITSSSKPTDISHLIKRKKPDTPSSSEAEAVESPAKRPAI